MSFKTSSEKALGISINLSALVNGNNVAIENARKLERVRKESAFQQTVLDQGLTYEAQIEYRKKQVEQEKKIGVVDEGYVAELESSIRDLRKLSRFKKIRDDYLSSYDELNTGKINLVQHKSNLQELLKGATDEDSRKQLREEISNVTKSIYDAENNTLQNRILVAQKDGTANLIQTTIDDVIKKKAFAELAGNTEEASMWDVSISSLRKQLNETKVANASHDIQFAINKGGMSAMNKLDALNREINNADPNTPVTVGGVTYNSTKEYWTNKRDSYISGLGTDNAFQSFFDDMEKEVKDKVDTVSRVTTFGFVPIPTLEAIDNDYRTLQNRAEFTPFVDRLNSSKTAALAYGVDKSGDALIQSSVQTLQLQGGLKELQGLATRFGVDTSTKQITLERQIIEKGSQLPGIKDSINNLARVGAEAPSSETPEQFTPAKVAEQKPPVIPKPNEQIVTPPANQPDPKIPAPVADQFKTVTINPGDTFSQILTRELGDTSRVDEVAKLNNLADINKIVAGKTLKIPVKQQ